jgi:FlaA1/EpsC-like NDP-sugar epimerase
MGEPMRIVDMVRMLTHLLGKRDDEVEITYTGLRHGEKLYEELFYENEDPLPTECGKVMRARGKLVSWDVLRGGLDELRALMSSSGDDAALRLKLSRIVPEYCWNRGSTPLSFPTARPIRNVAVESKQPARVGNPETGRVREFGALS